MTPDTARKAPRGVAAGMEINELRTDGKDFGLLVADGLAQWGIVPGTDERHRSRDAAAESRPESTDEGRAAN